MRVAAIDVGTNTTRLIVAEVTAGGYRDLDRKLTFTRLGEGVGSSRQLKPEAIERTLKSVAEYLALAGELGATRIRIAGTSALRDAGNRDEFMAGAEKLAGSTAEILVGEEEARLSFLGATFGMASGRYLVCDIGGGSTEFVLGGGSGVSAQISLDIGAVRLTERYLVADPPATEEMLLMEAAIDDELDVAVERIGEDPSASFVGVAGTVTTMAAIHLGLESYDSARTHHLVLTKKAIDDLYHMLASMGLQRRRSIRAMPSGRADVIVAGASILSRAMRRWNLEQVTVSERDILDGLVIDLIQNLEV